eukprot:TRINITY_DN892_c0_g1::TRINITY_DN892_c0_g1_i1::g.25400::m.25400 TRINITY_DN892_c0_g1::TRINITY_DN892_c0_g1_i1::g.25400  ORF type:complete len:283 (-),score=99.59,sp/P35705/PRDX3_BOVIN/54.35/2e-82,AhpC-TSA/PF00578.16/7.6e-38,Redoxin/PF08534.5/7.6e-15,1-cysPrx_C/PF10417.4/1.7e-14 TRINITY_DN892_c0_g1_i1:715-1494(-)
MAFIGGLRQISLGAARQVCAVRARPAATSFQRFYACTQNNASKITYPAPIARVGRPAPDFQTAAVVNGEITQISLQNYLQQGKYVVLFFYPKDFTYVCPTEILAFNDAAEEFRKVNAELIAISTDTPESHLAWIRTPRRAGGLGGLNIPLAADVTKNIANQYGVLLEDAGIALRGLFIINPQGVLEQATINNLPVGRSVEETKRLLEAFQFVAKHGEVCPANWKPGKKTMKADPKGSRTYFESEYGSEGEALDMGGRRH